MQKSIVVVGSLNLDLVAGVKRLPMRGETIIGRDFNTYCGGKGANQAVALAHLGAQVKLIGKLGSDDFATQLRESIEQAGVDTSCVGSARGNSGIALITTSTDGDNTIIVIPGTNSSLMPEDIERCRTEIEGADMVLGQLEIPQETTEYLGKLVRSAGIPFLLDPAPASPLARELMESVTWLTPNETEAQLLLKAHYPELPACSAPESAKRLLGLGIRNVILKLGAKGAYMAGADVESTYVDGLPVDVVESPAAGDAFNGDFAFALVQRGMAPKEAAEFACAVAALSVTRAGAQTSMPNLCEYEAFIARKSSRRSA